MARKTTTTDGQEGIAQQDGALKQFANAGAAHPAEGHANKGPGIGKIILAIAAVAFVAIMAIGLLAPAIGAGAGQCIGRIDIHGEISYEGSAGLFGGSLSAEEIAGEIRAADKDNQVGAILVDIDSPGGTGVASKELYDAVAEAKKPVVAYFGETAASGGYYAAAGADYIVANPNTLTGSIGARLTLLNYEGLYEKLGLREESIKSGELKDIGAGYRNATPQERELLDKIIKESAGNFVADVREGRKGKLTEAFEEVLDARVLGAKDALAAGLVDEIGSRDAAKLKAAKMAGMQVNKSELDSIEYCDFAPSRSIWDALSGMSSEIGRSFAAGLKSGLRSTQKLEYR
ncbi:MAG: signal peptide peptidase SppA [Candidatus Micrarchaeota archaeon]